MKRYNPFKGSGVAVITPFLQDGSVDFDTLNRLFTQQVESVTDFLCVLGTTAETPCLSLDERRQITRLAVSINKGKKPLLLGCGGNNTREVIRYVTEENLEGVDGLLIVTPYYNKPTQEGLYRHYAAICRATSLPIVLYNVPGRTGVNMEATTVSRLANEFPNVVAVKEASGKLEQIHTLIKEARDGFEVLCGDDCLAFDLIRQGAAGAISVVGNAYPDEFGKMIHLLQSKNEAEASEIHQKLQPFYPLLMVEGNPAGVKAFMAERGEILNELRPPLCPVSEVVVKKFQDFLASNPFA